MGGSTTGDSTTSTGTSSTTSDVSASSTTEEECKSDKEICCLPEGEFPPHELLNAFLENYPAEEMPKSHPGVSGFEPVANGHVMEWSDIVAGMELVDVDNGGVIEENIMTGLAASKGAAEEALPPNSTILDIFETPVVIEDLGAQPPCNGVGWAWGSILFEAEDTSIGELVYLYIGFCNGTDMDGGGDVEGFFYSDQAVEICAPIPQ